MISSLDQQSKISLSMQQQEAMSLIKHWFKNDRHTNPVFRLFGYAGTGKTTIALLIGKELGVSVRYGAFTGKASHVMRTKGCSNASTIHSLIYHTEARSRETLAGLKNSLKKAEEDRDHETIMRLTEWIDEERKNLSKVGCKINYESELNDYDLLVIDECSMIDEKMGKDLLSFKKPVIVLGDPAQLPPIKGGGFFTNRRPNYLMTEVHRHALDSPVYKWATSVRQGQHLGYQEFGDSFIKPRSKVSREYIRNADIVICGTNKSRNFLNNEIRKLRGFADNRMGEEEFLRKLAVDPEAPFKEGEQLVCLRNNHELGLQNGSVYKVVEINPIGINVEYTEAKIQCVDTDKIIMVEIANPILLDPNNTVFDCEDGLTYFDFGYVLTCHKSQGSQWENVLIQDESYVFSGSKMNWLYTAITRASKSVWIAR